jgi:hypothetical protein
VEAVGAAEVSLAALLVEEPLAEEPDAAGGVVIPVVPVEVPVEVPVVVVIMVPVVELLVDDSLVEVEVEVEVLLVDELAELVTLNCWDWARIPMLSVASDIRSIW